VAAAASGWVEPLRSRRRARRGGGVFRERAGTSSALDSASARSPRRPLEPLGIWGVVGP
jgi:hypothetical protein